MSRLREGILAPRGAEDVKIAPFPNPVQGITAFQGALAGAVLLVVFQDWLLQPFRDNGRPGNTARCWLRPGPLRLQCPTGWWQTAIYPRRSS